MITDGKDVANSERSGSIFICVIVVAWQRCAGFGRRFRWARSDFHVRRRWTRVFADKTSAFVVRSVITFIIGRRWRITTAKFTKNRLEFSIFGVIRIKKCFCFSFVYNVRSWARHASQSDLFDALYENK